MIHGPYNVKINNSCLHETKQCKCVTFCYLQLKRTEGYDVREERLENVNHL